MIASASSISTSMPMRRRSPSLRSICDSSRSTNRTSHADFTFGTMIVSRFSPAPSTTAMMSSYAYCVSRSLIRTQRTDRPQSNVFSAVTIWARAGIFAAGATASSRSRNTWSTAIPAALAIIFSLEPGTASWHRRSLFGLDTSATPLSPGFDARLRFAALTPGRSRVTF